MTRGHPRASCVEVAFGGRYAVSASGQVALEDYARVLTRADGVEALAADDDPGRVRGLHLCAPAVPPREAALEDIEAFAREMAERTGDGLGWS